MDNNRIIELYVEFAHKYFGLDKFFGGKQNLADVGYMKSVFQDYCGDPTISVIPLNKLLVNRRIAYVRQCLQSGLSIEDISAKTLTSIPRIQKYATQDFLEHRDVDLNQLEEKINKQKYNNMNYTINLNLAKLPGAQYANRGDGKVCIAIPTSTMFVNENGCFLSLSVWENRNKDFSSHYLKQSFSKEYREKLTEEQKKQIPILGNMKPMEVKPETTTTVSVITEPPLSASSQTSASETEPQPVEINQETTDDLPF